MTHHVAFLILERIVRTSHLILACGAVMHVPFHFQYLISRDVVCSPAYLGAHFSANSRASRELKNSCSVDGAAELPGSGKVDAAAGSAGCFETSELESISIVDVVFDATVLVRDLFLTGDTSVKGDKTRFRLAMMKREQM